jgi:hypothetical protein
MRGLETVATVLSQRAEPESSVPLGPSSPTDMENADKAQASLSGEFGQLYSYYGTSIGTSGNAIELPADRDSFFDPEQT